MKKAERDREMTQIFTEVLKGLSDEMPEKVELGQSEGNEDRNSLTTCGKNIPGRGTSKHKGLRRPVCWSAGIGEGGWWERKVLSAFASRSPSVRVRARGSPYLEGLDVPIGRSA